MQRLNHPRLKKRLQCLSCIEVEFIQYLLLKRDMLFPFLIVTRKLCFAKLILVII